MDSEVFLDNDLGGDSQAAEPSRMFVNKINFSWIRFLICFLVFIGLIFCKRFNAPYYAKIGMFYSERFKNDDEKISEIKDMALDRLENLRMKIKCKINEL
ncbi:MAG: hypothetical protein IKE41_01675 [Clostridia bacterium]|nr:hypothetical protein [Clostridia bacterium]MBR2734689.1 hypothetical protein [Clostridia bacterium]